LNRLIPIFLILISSLSFGQNNQNGFSIFPTGLNTFDTTELLPASQIQICSPGTIVVVRTSGSILTVGSGASSSAPQSVRFNSRTRQITASATATITSGTGTGKVILYGILNPVDNSLILKLIDSSNNTFTGSGLTVVSSTSTDGVSTAAKGIKLYEWPITSGAYASSGSLDWQTGKDCWVDRFYITNSTSSGVNLTITDGLGNPILGSPVSIPNGLTGFEDKTGMFMDSGILITAGTANAITVKVKGGRKY
jgi:hypothetical protein